MSIRNIKTNLTSCGNNIPSTNEKVGDFSGVIVALRDIDKPERPNLVGAIDIKAKNSQGIEEPGVFTILLNFNPEKAQGSLDYFTNIAKNAQASAGREVEWDKEFVMNDERNDFADAIDELIKSKAVVHFHQSATVVKTSTGMKTSTEIRFLK